MDNNLSHYKYNISKVMYSFFNVRKVIKESNKSFEKYKDFCYSYPRTGIDKNGIAVNTIEYYLDDIKNKNLKQVAFNLQNLQEFNIKSNLGNISCLMLENNKSNKWVIGLHGWTENKYLALRLVNHFWAKGYNILTFDSFAHGLTYGEKTDIGYSTMPIIDEVIDFLFKNKDVESIGLIGNSMGASTSILYSQKGKFKDNINWVIADCGFNSIKIQYRYFIEKNFFKKEWYKIGFRFTKKFNKETNSKQHKYELNKMMKKNINTPVLFIHSKGDTFIPYEMSVSMYQNKIKFEKTLISEIWTPDGSEHVNTIVDYNDEYVRQTLRFANKGEK